MSSDKQRRIRKIKMGDGRVEVEAIESWNEGQNERKITYTSTDEPDPALPAALANLPAEIRKLLGLPETWAQDQLTVAAVTFSKNEETGVKGAVMSCRAGLECAKSPLTLNTPHLPFEPYSGDSTAPIMPVEIVVLLEEVERHAEAYLDGKRAQMSLFAPNEANEREREQAEAIARAHGISQDVVDAMYPRGIDGVIGAIAETAEAVAAAGELGRLAGEDGVGCTIQVGDGTVVPFAAVRDALAKKGRKKKADATV